MDLYCIGEMVIDFTPGAEPHSYIRNAGGAPANVAIAAARNGLANGFCGRVGDDDFGRFLRETLHENGVRVLCPKLCKEAVTTMTFVTLREDGDRSFTFVRKPGADMFLTEADVLEEDLRDSTIIHAGSCSLSAEPSASATAAAIRGGRRLGKLVRFDVNYRNLMWNDDRDAAARSVEQLLPCVDLLKVSDEEIGLFGGREAIPAMMERFQIAVAVETLGADGCVCHFRGQAVHLGGYGVRACDTTGAGDAFWGGFLSKLILSHVKSVEDLNLPLLTDALTYGNAAGALSVQKKGAIASLPTRDAIETFLKEVSSERNLE